MLIVALAWKIINKFRYSCTNLYQHWKWWKTLILVSSVLFVTENGINSDMPAVKIVW